MLRASYGAATDKKRQHAQQTTFRCWVLEFSSPGSWLIIIWIPSAQPQELHLQLAAERGARRAARSVQHIIFRKSAGRISTSFNAIATLVLNLYQCAAGRPEWYFPGGAFQSSEISQHA